MTSQVAVRPEEQPVPPGTAPVDELELKSEITVQLVQHHASDLGVVRAARVSTVGEIAHTEEHKDGSAAGLIKYLMKCRHGSPFEHNTLTFLVSAPIFTVRHMMRHRTWSFNEESARYREVRPVFYVPDHNRMLRQKGKPGHYEYVPGEEGDHERLLEIARNSYGVAYAGYNELLLRGVAKEIARMVLPSATYSTLYATCNARALMHFLSLRTNRMDSAYPSHPQHEIAVVAEAMEDEWRRLMPITHAAFESFGRVAP